MNFQVTHPLWLLLWPLAMAGVIWLTIKSDAQLAPWRKWTAFALRSIIVTLLVLALAGLQWLRPIEGMNVFFALDRSQSVPSSEQELAREYVNRVSADKEIEDQAGIVVFGADAGIENRPNEIVDLQKVQAVVEEERTDLAGAIRLGTAAFPETGQKRIVILSDGNENLGDAYSAALSATRLGVSIDVVPIGGIRTSDVSVQRVGMPNNLKKGQTFDVKIYAEAEEKQNATVRLYRNNQFLGEQVMALEAGKNLFSFPQTLDEPGFYSYDVVVEGLKDRIPQNNRASGFSHVRGDPQILIVSSDPGADAALVEALRASKMEVDLRDITGFPGSLAQMQIYDAIFLSNVAAGDLGRDMMRLLESVVRDFGVGLVCIGGDQAYAAGGYRHTPLETTLPLDMELSSKKVLPNGALALVMHGMEFNNGNQVARDTAVAALDALGPEDEIGVILWDGNERWLFPLTKASDKKDLGRKIMGMNQGDLPSFQGVMELAYEGLKESTAHLKHIVVFSDGDPGAPSDALMESMREARITVSTVLIAGHAGPETMIQIADQGRGRFYDVRSPAQLPQIFIKEAAVILKSAIFEEPFTPRVTATTELVRGIGSGEYPQLLGYVATTPKPRAEIPLVSEKGDPILAHWQYGLGRAVAFTSDARPKWGQQWLTWDKYRQFWSQIAQWSLRRIDTSDFAADVRIENGVGHISVEALDADGAFRNFLNLETVVVAPTGESETIRLEQTGPGHYEAAFPTAEVGAYVLNLLDLENGQLRGAQTLGASVNYSPEFDATAVNINLLQRIAESTGGQILDIDNPLINPFLHDRRKTFQPNDLWQWLLRFAIILFPLDVGIRRIQLDREEWLKATQNLRRYLVFWRKPKTAAKKDESLAALLARRDSVRASRPAAKSEPRADLFQPSRPAESEGRLHHAKDRGMSRQEKAASAPSEAPAKETQEEAPNTTSRLLEAKRRARRERGGKE